MLLMQWRWFEFNKIEGLLCGEHQAIRFPTRQLQAWVASPPFHSELCTRDPGPHPTPLPTLQLSSGFTLSAMTSACASTVLEGDC